MADQNGGTKRYFQSLFSPNRRDASPSNKLSKTENEESPHVQLEWNNALASPPAATLVADAFQTRPLSALSGGHDRTNDEIHHSICINPALKALMGTRTAQRLRQLAQLGCTQHVYVNATHNRFEHSLGVSHLAKLLCQRLQTAQPLLGITEKDELCVEIAGFCHDLGHGPLSHVFEEFQNSLRSDENLEVVEWKHESCSIMMLNFMLEELGLRVNPNELDRPLQQIGDGIRADCFGVYSDRVPLESNKVLTSRDLMFVQECILGRPLPGYDSLVGRPWQKHFLYDIVNNTHSGLDVDKMDYYARDHQRTLGPSLAKILFLEEALVALASKCQNSKCHRCSHSSEPHVLMICYPTKLVVTAMDFFRTRFKLHTQVYQHKTVKAVEYMVCDVLKKAAPYVLLDGNCRIYQAVTNPRAYLQLTDSIIDIIAHSTKAEMKPAQELIARWRSRRLYKCVCSERLVRNSNKRIWEMQVQDIQKELFVNRDRLLEQTSALNSIQELASDGTCLSPPNCRIANADNLVYFDADDVVVEIREIHHGSKEENPVKFMRFLSKNQTLNVNREAEYLPIASQVEEDNYECHIPRAFYEKAIRIYNRSESEEKGKSMELCFREWLWKERNSDVRFATLSQLQ